MARCIKFASARILKDMICIYSYSENAQRWSSPPSESVHSIENASWSSCIKRQDRVISYRISVTLSGSYHERNRHYIILFGRRINFDTTTYLHRGSINEVTDEFGCFVTWVQDLNQLNEYITTVITFLFNTLHKK